MARISPTDRVLVIGCGIIPFTPLTVAQETHAKVVAIDNNPKAIALAKSYLIKKGFSDLIDVEYGDGINYPVGDFDVIFIATNVWPIETIFQHLASEMKNTARIICRDIKKDVKEVLDQENLSGIFSIISISKHPVLSSYTSLLLMKK